MKKLICVALCLVLALAAGAPAMAAGSAAAPYRLGVAVGDLSDPAWAAESEQISNYAWSKYGVQTNVMDAKDSSQTQLNQMQALIDSQVNFIILDAVDPAALADSVKRARDAGIMVLSYGDAPAGCNTYYNVDGYNSGLECGRMAGEFINKTLGGNCEVGLLNFPDIQGSTFYSTSSDGIVEGLAITAPNAKITSSQAAIDSSTAYEAVRSMTQEHPYIQVIVSISEGGAIGANNYVTDADINEDTFGVFGIGATKEIVTGIKNGEALKGCVGLGTSTENAQIVVDTAMTMLNGQAYKNAYHTPITPVTKANCTYYMSEAGW